MDSDINWHNKFINWDGKNIDELAEVLTYDEFEDMSTYSQNHTVTEMIRIYEQEHEYYCCDQMMHNNEIKADYVGCFLADLAVELINHIHWTGYEENNIELLNKYMNAWKSYIKNKAA